MYKIIGSILLSIYVGLIFYMMFKNNKVFRLRQRTLNDIRNAKVPFKKTMKMYSLYDTISYHKMMWRIFTPLKNIEKEFRKKVGVGNNENKED